MSFMVRLPIVIINYG